MIDHPIDPVYDRNSQILVLGSFPSVKSRQSRFYYGHPQNRFWKVLSGVFQTAIPVSVEEKTKFLLEHRIALWDVVASCEITGSADSSISQVTVNHIEKILDHSPIQKIYVNGKTAEKYYNRYLRNTLNRDAICLPSTSPANASWNLERLTQAWVRIRLDIS